VEGTVLPKVEIEENQDQFHECRNKSELQL